MKVNYPCRKCKYFSVCGDKNRTEKCNGKENKNKKTVDKQK